MSTTVDAFLKLETAAGSTVDSRAGALCDA